MLKVFFCRKNLDFLQKSVFAVDVLLTYIAVNPVFLATSYFENMYTQ